MAFARAVPERVGSVSGLQGKTLAGTEEQGLKVGITKLFFTTVRKRLVEQFDAQLLSELSVVILPLHVQNSSGANTLSQQSKLCSQVPQVALLESLKSTYFKGHHFRVER